MKYNSSLSRPGAGGAAHAGSRSWARLAPGGSDHGELLGRSSELAMLDTMIDKVRRGQAPPVLLRGAAGVGKTALLEAVLTRAEAVGVHVLRATGVESEVKLPLSGLHQLLNGLRDIFQRLAPEQQDVLDRALGLPQGAAPDRFVISATVLALLHAMAADRPVLLIVDDAQWIDQASAQVLGFVVRRLGPEPVGFLGAVRTEWKSFLDRSSLLECPVEPLEARSAAELLDSRFPALAPGVRQRLLHEAAGNPLALLELPALLSSDQLSGRTELPRWLSLGDRLESLYATRVGNMPEATRELLLLAAFESASSVRTIWSALPGGCIAADSAVIPAERAALVRVEAESGRLVFRHPLVRSAIVQLATPDRRRSAHRALAEVLDHEPERQIGHLIAASLGPDEAAARILESAAHRALRRGGATAAFSALRHASSLSPKAEDRSRRLAQAAFAASHAGNLEAAAEVLDSEYWDQASPEDAARAASASALRLIHRDGDVRAAHRLLIRALDNIIAWGDTAASRPSADELVDELFYLLIEASFYDGGPDLWAQVADRIGHASEFAKLSFDALGDPVNAGHTVGPRLRRAFANLPDETDPRRITQMAWIALYCDDLHRYREPAARAAELARTGGAFASWSTAVLLLAIEAYYLGQWDEAEAMLREGLQVAEEFEYRLLGCRMRFQLAFIEAGRGRAEAVKTLTDQVLAVAVPQGLRAGQTAVRQSRALSALGRGDYEAAYAQCVQVSPPGTFPAHVPCAMWSVLDLVEAAMMTGRVEEARAHVAAAKRVDLAALSLRTALLVAGAGALAATDDEAGQLFEEALALPDAERWAFDHARIRLAYGRWLRGRQEIASAREHLYGALEVLERLGAQPWVERARDEYRAAGAPVDSEREERTALTPQELQIAKLAATGLSNKEIAAELFLSHRTVSTHLYNLFPKLGVTSRARLRDALRVLGQIE
ncbi:ATP-binding protein [Streptomyces sp. NPDC056707]|uniref:ATP-binding protein n=1 Tax=Streptomyces sp. NPDC056707 TaxID=3345919 RepID=UPI0036C32992